MSRPLVGGRVIIPEFCEKVKQEHVPLDFHHRITYNYPSVGGCQPIIDGGSWVDELYQAWIDARIALEEALRDERELRARICGEELKGKLEGQHTSHRGCFKIKSTAVLNRAIDREMLEAIWDDLTWEEQSCVDWAPRLILPKYRPLEEMGCKMMEAIVVRPGMSQLEITKVTNGKH